MPPDKGAACEAPYKGGALHLLPPNPAKQGWEGGTGIMKKVLKLKIK